MIERIDVVKYKKFLDGIQTALQGTEVDYTLKATAQNLYELIREVEDIQTVKKIVGSLHTGDVLNYKTQGGRLFGVTIIKVTPQFVTIDTTESIHDFTSQHENKGNKTYQEKIRTRVFIERLLQSIDKVTVERA